MNIFNLPILDVSAETYKTWENWLQLKDILRSGIRWLVFQFHKLLYLLALHTAEAFTKITNISLLDNEALNNTYKKTLLIGISLLILGIIYLGFKYLFREQDHRKNINNLIITIMILTGMTVFMGNISTLVTSITQNYSSNGMKDSVENAFKLAFFDMNKPDSDGFSKLPDEYNPRIDLSADDLTHISINSTINEPKSEVMKNKFDGKNVKKAQIGTIVHFDDEVYYQFGYAPLTSFITLLVLNLVFLLSGFKVAKQLMELVFMKIISPLIAGLDVANGQTMKKLLQEIIKGYGLIVFVFIVVEVYVALMGFATSLYNLDVTRAYSVDLIVYLTFIIASAYFVIDGPKILEKLLGLDTGLTKEGKRAAVVMGFIASKIMDSFGNNQSNHNSSYNGSENVSQNNSDNTSMYYDSRSDNNEVNTNGTSNNHINSDDSLDNENSENLNYENSQENFNESGNASPNTDIYYDSDKGSYDLSNGNTYDYHDSGMYYDSEKGSYNLANDNFNENIVETHTINNTIENQNEDDNSHYYDKE